MLLLFNPVIFSSSSFFGYSWSSFSYLFFPFFLPMIRMIDIHTPLFYISCCINFIQMFYSSYKSLLYDIILMKCMWYTMVDLLLYSSWWWWWTLIWCSFCSKWNAESIGIWRKKGRTVWSIPLVLFWPPTEQSVLAVWINTFGCHVSIAKNYYHYSFFSCPSFCSSVSRMSLYLLII